MTTIIGGVFSGADDVTRLAVSDMYSRAVIWRNSDDDEPLLLFLPPARRGTRSGHHARSLVQQGVEASLLRQTRFCRRRAACTLVAFQRDTRGMRIIEAVYCRLAGSVAIVTPTMVATGRPHVCYIHTRLLLLICLLLLVARGDAGCQCPSVFLAWTVDVTE